MGACTALGWLMARTRGLNQCACIAMRVRPRWPPPLSRIYGSPLQFTHCKRDLYVGAHMTLAQWVGFKAIDSLIFDNVVRALRLKWYPGIVKVHPVDLDNSGCGDTDGLCPCLDTALQIDPRADAFAISDQGNRMSMCASITSPFSSQSL